MRESIQPISTFDDTSDINVRKMATFGIVIGTGNGNFNPLVQLTREQTEKIPIYHRQVIARTKIFS